MLKVKDFNRVGSLKGLIIERKPMKSRDCQGRPVLGELNGLLYVIQQSCENKTSCMQSVGFESCVRVCVCVRACVCVFFSRRIDAYHHTQLFNSESSNGLIDNELRGQKERKKEPVLASCRLQSVSQSVSQFVSQSVSHSLNSLAPCMAMASIIVCE